ncbi:metal-dependent hydrolase [Tepidibacter formicigenes]|jgi:inner membrane protein|uniref:Inner membrane protein n=1 Tax=Tepidibacter formicigenes DSM 15518 TaxID=1123349 RepID=A0A1M6PCZ5_9FIRM|nr:metal-dependent hydrolase [Tepidibacter formicigenes]SHK05821.1 inner membrane protein [Tepidibacter formicigenes DSM 15518]
MKGVTHFAIGALTAVETSLLIDKPLTPSGFIFACVFSLLPDIDEPNSKISTTLIKSSFSKAVYRYTLYLINMIIFFILIYINKNLVLNFIISFSLIILIENKLKHALLRKCLFSLLSIILSLSLYYIKAPFPFISLSIFLGVAPWLKHRGFTHSILGVMFIYYLLNEIEQLLGSEYIALYGTIGYLSHLFLGDIFTKMGIPIFYPIFNKKISLGFIKVGSFIGNLFEIIYIFIYFSIVIYTLKYKI